MINAIPDRKPPADRATGVWDYISPSRLALWLKCPLAFKLRYRDGVRTRTGEAAFMGKMVHSALETYYRNRQLGLTLDTCDLAIQLGKRWAAEVSAEGVVFATREAEGTCWKKTIALVGTYLAALPADEPAPIAVEVSLEAPLVDPRSGESLGIPLVGVLDLVLAGERGPKIVDFKTASRGGVAEITHELQLTAYAYLLRARFDRNESGLEIRQLVKTKAPRVLCFEYGLRTEAHFGRFFAAVRAYLDDLEDEKFVFRPNLACMSCEFRDRQCKAWKG